MRWRCFDERGRNQQYLHGLISGKSVRIFRTVQLLKKWLCSRPSSAELKQRSLPKKDKPGRVIGGAWEQWNGEPGLPLKNVSLAERFHSGKKNGNDENIKGALHARIQTSGVPLCKLGRHTVKKSRHEVETFCQIPLAKLNIVLGINGFFLE